MFHPIIPNYRYHIKIKWKFFRQPPLPSGELGEGVFFCLKYSPFTALWQLHICASGTHPTGRRAGKHKSGYAMTDQCEKNRTILSGNYLWLYCPWWGRMRWYRSEIMILPVMARISDGKMHTHVWERMWAAFMMPAYRQDGWCTFL